MPRVPRKRSGSSPADIEWNAAVDFMTALVPIRSPGETGSFGQRGVSRIVAGSTGAAASKPSSITVMTITVVGLGDYFTAVPTYGSGAAVSVAKPHLSRPSLTTQVWDGSSFAIAYSDDSHRTSDNGLGTVQNEVCYPRIAVGTIILAMKSSNGTGIVGVDWIDVTAHIWQKAI